MFLLGGDPDETSHGINARKDFFLFSNHQQGLRGSCPFLVTLLNISFRGL